MNPHRFNHGYWHRLDLMADGEYVCTSWTPRRRK